MPPRKESDIANDRLTSRQSYLEKRANEQLILLQRQVEDEAEEERKGLVTAKEKLEFARNRELLQLALSRNAIDEHRDGYLLPDSSLIEKADVLNRRLDDKIGQKSEVQQWEDEQTTKARAQISKPSKIQEEEFEFVFDETQAPKFDVTSTLDPDKRMLEEMLDMAEKKAQTIDEVRKSLPMYQYRDQLLDAIEQYQIIIVTADTGSKTTQILQYLLETGKYAIDGKRLGCTQPRRVAAMSVAARVAEERGTKLGHEIGYNVRFDNCTDRGQNPSTGVFLTDGMLLREMMVDGTLSKYNAIVIDEAHERSVATDVLMALTKDLCRIRPEFRLIVSSATLNSQEFSKYFDDAPIFSVPGRMHKVDIHHVKSPEANFIQAIISCVFQLHISQPVDSGDILVFVPGREEIEAIATNIEDTARKIGNRCPELIVAPIYSQLPADLQQRIFLPTPKGARKVVVATNIAETSLTIPGIVYVIDSGYAKENNFNPTTGMSSLTTVPISRASANQRSGRAGRTAPGSAFRIYTKWSFYNEMDENTTPDILRIDLASTLLQLLSLGITDIVNFDLLSPPPAAAIISSMEQLYSLGVLNDKGQLTKVGRRMSLFPTEPMLSRSILAAEHYGCVDEIITVIAMLQSSASLFFRPKDQRAAADAAHSRFAIDKSGGDLSVLAAIYEQFVDSDYSMHFAKENFLDYKTLISARAIREQLQSLCDMASVPPSSCGISDTKKIRLAFLTGFFPHAAQLQRDGLNYRTTKGQNLRIHPSSSVSMESRPKWICYYELVLTSHEYARNVMPIDDPLWLQQVAPHYYNKPEQLEALGTNRKMPKGKGKVGV
ncbi:P-loop containing nucleoside triphosphate hydrolase protein [Pleomassaria siparia CBS 279.74]|uniref:RNA helicase n=1 Tax=Pleomassaria siparia CBS 279.74 TaxID=1314801 RepID=A0A6G1KGA1_9PLEO|nr:P-loop containing nucleoside triphosphate hydrolase protein [Pleomassaria siparia CBS 279.74]